MIMYILHFEPAFRHATHYCGSTDDIQRRIYDHCHGHGAIIVKRAIEFGSQFRLAAIYQDDSKRSLEMQRKKSKHPSTELCPICRPSTRVYATKRLPSEIIEKLGLTGLWPKS